MKFHEIAPPRNEELVAPLHISGIQTATDRQINQRIMRYQWITKHAKRYGNQASAMQ